ncbi:MAG TPA: radical SAM protein [Elusimicrobiota bacterium]|nr:radical SAM protein [Elusimicrobiota bacterium]
MSAPKDILLIHPPFVRDSWEFPLAVPMLKSYLERRSVSVDALDLNGRYVEWLLSPAAGQWRRRSTEAMRKTADDPLKMSALRHYLQLSETSRSQWEDWRGESVRQDLLDFLFQAMHAPLSFPEHLGDDLGEYVARHGLMPFGMDDFLRTVMPPLQRETDYKIIGFSITLPSQWGAAIAIVRMLRAQKTDAFLVLGGATMNTMTPEAQEKIMRMVPVDGIVRFAGEKPLLELVRILKSRGDLKCVPALIYRSGKNIVGNDPRPVEPAEPDPPPDFSDFSVSPLYSEDRYVPLLYARGCSWGRCVFCSYPRQWAGAYFRPVGDVVRDLKHHHDRYGQRKFKLMGDEMPPRYAKDLAEALREHSMGVQWWTFARSSRGWTAELLEKVAASGGAEIALGVESFDGRVLKTMNKGYSAETAERNIGEMGELGIKTSVDLIWDFPTTTYEEAKHTWSVAKRLAPLVRAYNCFTFGLEPHSEMGRHPERFGIEFVTIKKFLAHQACRTSQEFLGGLGIFLSENTGGVIPTAVPGLVLFPEIRYWVDKRGMTPVEKREMASLWMELAVSKG